MKSKQDFFIKNGKNTQKKRNLPLWRWKSVSKSRLKLVDMADINMRKTQMLEFHSR